MLATSVRVSPCSARCSPRSLGRVTTSWSPPSPSSRDVCCTVMSRGMRSDSSPLGPLTVTRSGSIATVTPAGTGIGCLPIRDIAIQGLPDRRYDFAAHALQPGVVAGHHAAGRRDDRRAHAALDPRDVRVVDVGALAGTRHALHARDHGLALVGVLERHRDRLARLPGARGHELEALDVPLLLENPRELALELRGGDRDVAMLRLGGVAQASQEVRDGISHRHGYQLD